MHTNLKTDPGKSDGQQPRPIGATLLVLYRDDLHRTLGDSRQLDPLLRAALTEAAGLAAWHQGRRTVAAKYFARAAAVLALSGRVRPSEAAA